MTYLRTLDNLISKIHSKINNHKKSSIKDVTKKEVEDFICFLRRSN